MTKKWLASTWPLPALLVWLLAWGIFAALARLLPWWLALLVAHLPALRLQGADSQAAASLAVADVLDALEACAEEPGERASLPD